MTVEISNCSQTQLSKVILRKQKHERDYFTSTILGRLVTQEIRIFLNIFSGESEQGEHMP